MSDASDYQAYKDAEEYRAYQAQSQPPPAAPQAQGSPTFVDRAANALRTQGPLGAIAGHLLDPVTRKVILDNTVGPGAMDMMYSAKKGVTDSIDKYAPTPEDPSMAHAALDIQDSINKKLQGIPDIGEGDPNVAAKYGTNMPSVATNMAASLQGTKDFFHETHGVLQQMANPFMVPMQFAVREAITGLQAFGKMPEADAKNLLSQKQLFWSDMVNYYWTDPKSLPERAARLVAGMGANILFDPLSLVTGIGKLTEQAKQVQVFGDTLNMSKSSNAEIAVAKTASRVAEIISGGTADENGVRSTSLANVEAVKDFSKGKIGFGDMTRMIGDDIPAAQMDDIKIAGAQGLGQPPTYLEGLADRSRAPHFGLKIPFTNKAIEYSPGFATDLTQIAGKGAISMMNYVSNADQYSRDWMPGFIGSAYTGVSNGVRGTLNALRQMKTKTGIAPWDATVNWLRGDNTDIQQKANDMTAQAQQLISNLPKEHIASIINVIENENKNPAAVLNELGHDPYVPGPVTSTREEIPQIPSLDSGTPSINTKRVFTKEEAEAMLPLINKITDQTKNKVNNVLNQLEAVRGNNSEAKQRLEALINQHVTYWQTKLIKLGADPKGLWLADFDNGKNLFCWKHGDTEITHVHSYSEGLSARVPIQEGETFGLPPETFERTYTPITQSKALEKIQAGNDKAAQIRASFPPETADQINKYIDMHQDVNENALSSQQAQGLPVKRLDPLKAPNSPAAYIAHVVAQKLKDFKAFARQTIGISDAATEARMGITRDMGAAIDSNTYGREDTRTVEQANEENKKALGVEKFVNNPAELMLHTYINARQNIQKNILLKSALDTSVQYSGANVREAAALEQQFKMSSELAEAHPEGSAERAEQITLMSQIEPRLQQLKQKMMVPDNYVKVNPNDWREMVDIVGEDGRVITGADGKAQLQPKAHLFVPQEFVQDDYNVFMHPQVYSQAKEIANPYRNMSAPDLFFDKVGRITDGLKSIYVSRPGTAGVITLGKMSEFLINGTNYPISSLKTAVRMMEPPAPITSVINKFGTFDKTLSEQKPILSLPDGTQLTKQDLNDMLTHYNVTGSSIAQPVQWEGVLNQLAGTRKYNQQMGTVPKTALEMATMFRSTQYVVKTTDDFFKTATFTDKLLQGYTPQAAADAVERQYFNFNNTNRTGAGAVVKPLSIFIAHPIKALESAVWKMAQGPLADLSVPWKVNHTLQGAYIQSPEERQALSEQVPMYDQIKDPVLGPMMPGGREMMVDPSYSNQTISMFLDPRKNLNPILSIIATGLASKSKTRFDGDVEESAFLGEVKNQASQLLPYPIKMALQVAEASGVIDTSKYFGRGGLFGDIEKPPVNDTPGAHLHFNDSLEFGNYVQHIMGENGLYNLLFKPLQGDTLKEQEQIIARGNMMASTFRDLTAGQAYIRNMDTPEHQVDERFKKNGEDLKSELKRSYMDTAANEEQALKDRWSGITKGQIELSPTDRSFLINMGAMNRSYGDLSEQFKKQISDRGLMPDATAVDDYEKLQEIAKSNPIAAQMVATKQKQVALHAYYVWALGAQQEAQEKTGVPGYNPFKLLFGLEHVDFSPEARSGLDDLKSGVGPYLNQDENQKQILQNMNYDTIRRH